MKTVAARLVLPRSGGFLGGVTLGYGLIVPPPRPSVPPFSRAAPVVQPVHGRDRRAVDGGPARGGALSQTAGGHLPRRLPRRAVRLERALRSEGRAVPVRLDGCADGRAQHGTCDARARVLLVAHLDRSRLHHPVGGVALLRRQSQETESARSAV